MDSIEQMRKLIDAVKADSFTAPLPQVAQNLAQLATATKDMADRLAMRIDKNINIPKQSKKKPNKPKSKKQKPIPRLKLPSQTNQPKQQTTQQQQSVKPMPKPQSATANNPFATANPTYSSATSSNDLNALKTTQPTQANPLSAIKPIPPQ